MHFLPRKAAWGLPFGVVLLASCASNSSLGRTGADPIQAPGPDSSVGQPGNPNGRGGNGQGSGQSDGASGSWIDAPATPGPPDLALSADASSAADSAAPMMADARAASAPDAFVDGSQAAVDGGPPAVRFVGRVDRTNAAGPRFSWSGSTILARFTGSSIGVRLSGPQCYFDVSIDGILQSTPLVLMAGKTDYPLASNLAAGAHDLTVYRRNEAGISGLGDTTFLGLILDPAGGALLPPNAPAPHRLENIGDSTTTGYGNEGTNANCGFSLATQNFDSTYGAVAARAVNADLITIAWTAKGLWRNFGGDMTDTIPVLYGRTLGDQTTDTWDFTSWIADAVVINLGNDFGVGDPGQPYVTTYNAFIRRIRKNYPNALILCVVGPKLSGASLAIARTYVMGIVSAMNASGDQNVAFFELPQPQPVDGVGCGGHASVAAHKRMGDALAAELKAKLGW